MTQKEDYEESEIYSQNPFSGILTIDLWILLTVGYYFRSLIKIIPLMLRILLTMSIGAILALIYIFIYSALSQSFSLESFNSIAESKHSNELMKQELERLRSKTLSLELSIRKMNSQLKAVYSQQKNQQENLPDFASESAGGSILDTPDTESFYEQSQIQATLLGIPIWKPSYFTPRKIIQPWNEAGECWAFRGNEGKIEMELAYLVYISQVTLEHIPASASLTGIIDSAPREFRVLGKFRSKYILLGTFIYNDQGPPFQTFSITREDVQKTPIKQVMLHIVSNWGNSKYTCIYRFRVHGKIFDNFENK